MEIIRGFFNLLFRDERVCLFCKENPGELLNYICSDCKERLEFLDREFPLDSSYIDIAYYSMAYNRYMKELINQYKFQHKTYLYKAFGEILLASIKNLALDKDIDIITYIPSHKRKEAIRGYNQSELMAIYISDRLDIELSKDNLIKIRQTKAQSSLNRMDRLKNVRGSFGIKNEDEIRDKNILIIDDLITTGSTVEECGKTLKEKGAKKVKVIALTSSKKR